MTQRLIIFDFDDTLVSTNPLFDRAKEMFADLMHVLGLYHHEVLDTVNTYDIAMIKHYGCFAKECFPLALVKTYEHYCELHNREPDNDVKKKVYDIGMWIFEQEPQVLEEAEDTLKQLNGDYKLVLLTKGDEQHQKQKIVSSGLSHYFLESIVVPDKDKNVFSDIAKRHRILPQLTWSVGNSIKADINPALQVGMKAIWVEGPTWDFEHEEPLMLTPSVKRLGEIPPIIKKEEGDGLFTKNQKISRAGA